MMKRVLLISFIFSLMLSINPANATSVLVQSRERYSTKYPRRYVSLKVVEPAELKNGINLEQNSIISGRVIEVKNPKRGKRNAYFIFVPLTYTVPSRGVTKNMSGMNIEAKLVGYKKADKKKTAEKAGVSAGGFVLPGFSQAYWFGKGVANPLRGKTRFSSGVYTMYKNSPFVYVEEGDELIVRQGTYLKLKFYYSNKPNWQIWKQV